ncbi:hypothetical protein [Cetobacterium sp.]|uniref:hypothetical protein n=1 Tax=Cetobacterium sp. TaxID=2071632 RepID=UPI003F4169FE
MLKVYLQKKETMFLEKKFFIVKEGKVIIKNILENGEIIVNENCINKDEIAGNFLLLSSNNEFMLPEVGTEVEAMEDSILEEIRISKKDLLNNLVLKKLIDQLIKSYTLNFLSHFYDTPKFLLILLKLYADSKGNLSKQDVHYENFNISKSQFYLILSKLKKGNFFKENKNNISLNLKRVEWALNPNNIKGALVV